MDGRESAICTKYDTKSERAGEILHTSDTLTFAPYYTDGRIKSNWSKDSKKCSELLKEEYIKKMSLLYNWTANSFHGVYIYYLYLNCYSTDLREMFDWEGVARSVRCVKDL